MRNRNWKFGAALLVLTLAWPAAAQYSIDWYTIDGGGAMNSSGGPYTLSGTIGQPDAGVANSATYLVHGGFWGSAAPGACLGDANCDGVISWRDIDFFIAGLNSNYPAWATLFPGNAPTCAFSNLDCNNDSVTSWRDIDPFIALLNTFCP